MSYHKFETEKVEGFSIVDETTGELIELKQRRKVEYDNFLLIFVSTIPEMYKLQGNEVKVLMACWKYCTFNEEGGDEGNMVYNTISFKKKLIADGCSLSFSAIDSYMSTLRNKGFLIKKGKAEYMLNPALFFKGRPKDASKMMLNFEYNKENNEQKG